MGLINNHNTVFCQKKILKHKIIIIVISIFYYLFSTLISTLEGSAYPSRVPEITPSFFGVGSNRLVISFLCSVLWTCLSIIFCHGFVSFSWPMSLYLWPLLYRVLTKSCSWTTSQTLFLMEFYVDIVVCYVCSWYIFLLLLTQNDIDIFILSFRLPLFIFPFIWA